MLSDKCTWPWGHCLFFDLRQAPTPRLAVIMVKREPVPIDNRRSLSCRLGRWCDGQVCPDVGREIMAPWLRRPGRREESPDGENLRRALKNRSLGRLEWKGRKDDERRCLSTRTIRRRLQQSGLSARRSLLGLPLTQNHRRLRHQWCDERRIWAAEWNEDVFTDESPICLQHHDGRIRVWRHRGERMLNSCVMYLHTGPTLGIMIWGGIGYHSRTPLVRIAGTLNSQRYISEVLEPVVLSYLQGLATAIFQQDKARPHVACIIQRFFANHQIELLPWSARSPYLSPIENMWSMVAQ
ncbi:transposable element Tcb1 transposase [Trichonephila clavipes]|nr:transposable element Tcb1 transposase [Trichonephila clavipes]